MGLDDKYIVQHHRYAGSIEMDLVVANKATNRILCVVEVKRTIAAVNSTRYQYQAMSYVQALSDMELEKPYYMLTNLEASCLFKYDARRKNVYEQILQPGIKLNKYFRDTTKEKFMKGLIQQYAGYIADIVNNKGEYLRSFRQFAIELGNNLYDEQKWKRSLVALFYEYIRGAFTKVGRKGLKTIGQLSDKLDLVCKEGLKINFKDIFTMPAMTGKNRNIYTDKNLLAQLFDLGKTYVDADELASVMHRVISSGHEHEGEVPTDTELATAMLRLVRNVGNELTPDMKIMDPAAGGGNLLCAAIDVFNGIEPSQIIANDINPHLLQLLSLRLGLRFAATINPLNTTTIYTKNIASLNPKTFNHVEYIVMNPPYLSATGKECSKRKSELYKRIRALKRQEPTTTGGQMPLEGVFVELVACLAKEGCIMGAILPYTHLTTKGEAAVKIRKMLLEDFGLEVIFSYPQENLFDGVNQNTIVVVGRKGSHAHHVKYIHCNSALSDIDSKDMTMALQQPMEIDKTVPMTNDFDGCMMQRKKLEDELESGWMVGNIVQQEAINFLNLNINSNSLTEMLECSELSDFKRGKIGNSGCTDLMFLRRNDKFLLSVSKKLAPFLRPALNKADYDKYDVSDGQCYFLDFTKMTDNETKDVVTCYFKYRGKNPTKQKKEKKSISDYIQIMERDARKVTPSNSVFLPRALRTHGKVFISTSPIYVSTNFFVFETDAVKAPILSSWMSTVFFQLECEAYGNNRKGFRKMEKADYGKMHIPVIDKLSDEQKLRICQTPVLPFLDLRQPTPRLLDKLWAHILFKETAEEKLNEATDLLAMLAAAREK